LKRMYAGERTGVCVYERESDRIGVCVYERERDRRGVCVYDKDRDRERDRSRLEYVCAREKSNMCACVMCACVNGRERERVCV
jgi:hypothetical protein